MRVLLDCRMVSWSGVGRYSAGLARALADISDVEIVQMVAAGSAPPVTSAEWVEAGRHPFSVAGALEFGRIARRLAPDVTHCLHFPTPFPAPGPLVVTVQDLTPLTVDGAMPSPVRRVAYRAWMSRAVAAADRIVTPSARSADDVVRYFPRAAGRVTPVLLAADDFTSGEVAPLPRWLSGSRYLLSMGNTKPHKDLPTLLRAFASQTEPDLLLVLVGEDPGGYAASVLKGNAAAGRVHFTGRVDDGVLRALYAGAFAFVFPSRYEGFGLPPLEAMSFGIPVISSNAGSLPEVVGDAALLVDPGDVAGLAAALGRVFREPELSGHLAEAGRRRAAAFTWAATATATIAVYRAAMGDARVGAP